MEAWSRSITAVSRKGAVWAQLPTRRRIGEKLVPTRVDIAAGPTAVEDTLEAIASGARLITNAHLAAGPFAAVADILVRADSGVGFDANTAYFPVVISGHSVAKSLAARGGKTSSGNMSSNEAQRGKAVAAGSSSVKGCRAVDIGALSLGRPVEVPWRVKTVGADSQRAAIAHLIVEQWGCASGSVGFIGLAAGGPRWCFLVDASTLLPGLSAALSEPIPAIPSRVKECRSCEFHNHCRAQLVQREDISLLLPGDRNRQLRDDGIRTLGQLEAAGRGELSELAGAWLHGEVALRRPHRRWWGDPKLWAGAERDQSREPLPGVVEVDVDMEAHPERGTFLWGAFDGQRYLAFADFSPQGDEGQHVAEFWYWLQQQRKRADQAGKTFVAWVYAAQGENYWLRFYARRYGGKAYRVPRVTEAERDEAPETIAEAQDRGSAVGQRQRPAEVEVRMPTVEEVEAFIASDRWADVFAQVRRALVGTESLGLKAVAPLAGFTFSQQDVDGRAAIGLFEQAVRSAESEPQAAVRSIARKKLERYNADDCVASRRVREWLRRGAPGIRGLQGAD
ncbi:hypothetical protein CHEID_00550 [Corynebacterium heidelbergense]|uniref:YprB ribonuclease H-like domain-containing protein n=2 Tax=Corynebacterium heidelbergense TaxID=2055947 RepID=A0A364V9N8_9CORY|nr:hypothetical protein CWC39_09025 [Corynebacterium heidelbergense]WCZ35689.1 hypothetical protein CHEID_00550 [Corynebacterium heidelbergense]